LHSARSKPLFCSLEKCSRDLRVVNALKESEKPDRLVMELEVPVVHRGGDASHYFCLADREKVFNLGM
jgi:hypothetical protein